MEGKGGEEGVRDRESKEGRDGVIKGEIKAGHEGRNKRRNGKVRMSGGDTEGGRMRKEDEGGREE